MVSIFRKKYPIIRQYDQIDCGPAVLLSILKYYGGNANVVYVRELCETDVHGSTLFGIVKAAKNLGFDALGAKGSYKDLMNETMPCIAHIKYESGLNHFIIVYKINSKKVLVGDPGKGLYKLSKEKFVEIWEKHAVILLKPNSKLYNTATSGWIKWIRNYLKKNETWVYQTLFLGIIYTGLGLSTAVFVQWLIDRFIPEKDLNKIIYTGLFLLFMLILKAIAGYFRQRFLIILNKKVTININSDFLNHIFRLPKKFFDTRKIGDITARINDSMKIQKAILLITTTTIIDSLIVIGSLALMSHLAVKLAIIALLLIPVYALILFSKIKIIKKRQSEVMQGHAQVESSYIDSLKGIDDILGFNVSKTFTQFNKNLFKNFQNKIESLGFTQTSLSLMAGLSGGILTVSFLSYGAILVIENKLLLGQMIASYSLLANILPAISNYVIASIELQGAHIAARRLRDILLAKQEQEKGNIPFKVNKSINIINGSFSWPKSDYLFKDLNLSIEKGKITSLWGKSGTGKSTLVQILQRKYQLTQGEILVDNIQAEKILLSHYRHSIAVIPQTIKLFNGTLAENITVGREVKSIDEILNRIQKMSLNSFINRFQYGLLTILGEDSRKLSGGEMQMLGLIRALYDCPEVLIIDEGFSAMDIEIENILFNTLKEYAEDHIILNITHNLRIILQTDYIYLLDDGKIIEHGSTIELLQNKSSYLNALIRMQNSYKSIVDIIN